MEPIPKLSGDIKEEEEEISSDNSKEENNIKKKPTMLSSGTKNDENIDSNMNKDMKRHDTLSSFGLRMESSNNNLNNIDTNKSESENNNNKSKEYTNTNSSDKKLKKKKTLKSKDNIQMILSSCLLEIIIRNKEDMNIIFKRKKYKEILEDMKKTNNFYEIYKPIQEKETRNLNEIMFENKKYINKPILMLNISSKEEIELEFYKYGSIFKNPIRKRFGILTDNNFYSSTEPIAKFKKNKSKQKTRFILYAQAIIKENYEEIIERKETWHNEDKKFRLRINYLNEKNKENHFLIYFFEEKERDDILELIKLIKLNITIKDQANEILKSMDKRLSQNDKFYVILKMLAVKRKLKNKKEIKKYINDIIKKDKNEFSNFIKNIKINIQNKYIEQKKFFLNKGIQRINKNLILKNDFLKNKTESNESSLNEIKKACNTIYKALKNPLYFNNKRKTNNNFVAFKIKLIENEKKRYRNNEYNLLFNYKDISINYADKAINNIFLDKEQIFHISNVIYNYKFENYKENNNQYNMIILGPYNNNNNNIFSYDLNFNNKKIMNNIYNKYNHRDVNKFNFLICQIFNIEINKSEIKNFNFVSSITEEDYFYLKIIGGLDNNLTTKTKLFNPKTLKDNKIIIELNLEIGIPYEFFENKGKSIQVILYHINKNDLNDINNYVLYLDYMNKVKVKQLNLNLDSFINIPSYEMPFDECIKSKIFWNLIVIDNQNKYNLDETYEMNYFNKSFNIGNKFFYLDDIKNINNKNDIPNYYKYEKIERYLQNTKIKENSNEILCLCEYIGINEKQEIVFFNLVTNEYKKEQFNKNKFLLFNNNNFNILNNEIISNFNNDTNENFIKLFKWYKIISFKNEIQILSFLEILKKLHQLSFHDYFYNKNYGSEEQNTSPYGHEINRNLLYNKLKNDKKSKNNFRFILELNKLELKNNFEIDKNSIVNIEILSRSSNKSNEDNYGINTRKLNLFNTFMNNAYKYENKFIINNEEINSLKDGNIKNTEGSFYICFTNKIKLNSHYFSNNDKVVELDMLKKEEKIINFDFDIFNNDIIIINLDWYYKKEQKHMYIVIDINKDFFNSLVIKNSIKKNLLPNENFNFNDIYADYLILPVFVSYENCYSNIFDNVKIKNSKIISGILTFKIICFNSNPKYLNDINMNSFEKITNENILEYINYLLIKKDEIIKTIGDYEPNIYKNYLLSKIIKLYNKLEKNNINEYLDIKGVLTETLLPDLNLILNKEKNNSLYFINKFKKYLYKYKRNLVYNRYIESLWEKILINDKNINNNINNIYDNFPSKDELLNLYKKNDNLFFNIQNLIHLGLPNLVSRRIIWEKLLNIKELVNKTRIKLSDYNLYNSNNNDDFLNEKEFSKRKGEIYTILYEISKNNESEEYFLLIDNIIDLNIINLKNISNNLDLIKNITIIFYQWTLFNIGETSNATAVNNVSKIKNLNEIFDSKSISKNEYCYYSGVLYLCEKLFKYFKSPSETFWYLVGLSQVIPLFNINYNLYELTIYNLVIKLILEQYHPDLYKKFISLNFPFEYFFSKHITYFYSSFFEDIETFMKIMDILIFESVFSIYIYKDPISHLRFLCTIILTILIENKDKILAVENIYQLEKLFKIIKFKKYNISIFFEKLNYNIYKYFNNDKKDKFGINNINWENNRIKIEKILDKYYYSDIKNIYSYLQENFKKMNLIIQNNPETEEKEDIIYLNNNTNIINVSLWKDKIRNFLNKYSNKENVLNTYPNNNKNNDTSTHKGILMIFRQIKIFKFFNDKQSDVIDINGEIEINIFLEKSKFNNKNKLNQKIIIDKQGNILINEKEDKFSYCLLDYKYHSKDDNNLIITLKKDKQELFKFKININNINLLNPIKLEIHSYESFIESTIAILEISLIKYYTFLLSDEYCNLYLSFFSPNEFKIDNIINSEYLELKNIPNISELIYEERINRKFEDLLHENIIDKYHKELCLIYQYYLDRNFLCSNKKFNTIKNEQLSNETKNIIKELFLINGDKNLYAEKIINLIENENKSNKITIMEILIGLYLDNDIMNLNMNDILYNLYKFTMIANKKNICTISNIVELIYIIYKKYSIFYEYRQVKNMVNYFFQKEKYSFIKNVSIYNKSNKIDNLINNKNINFNVIKNKFSNIKKIIDYIDVTSEFLFIFNNFSEICNMFDLYNKSDLNPQSKNNVILILKMILFDIFINNNENSEKKKYDKDSYDFIVIEFHKEYTYEELFFSFKYNEEKNYFDVEFLDENDSYKNINFDYKEKKLKNKNIFELVLLYADSNFLFNNINNEYLDYNISFDDFKNIFTNLPYLNDILFKNIYKLFSRNDTKLISNKNIKYDKISVNIMNNSRKIFEFIFVTNFKTKNYKYNSNFTRIYNSIIINYNIYSNFTIKKIYDIIINKIEYQDLEQLLPKENKEISFDIIKDAIRDFTNILFYTIEDKNKYNFLEPFLPLYINFSSSNKKVISFNLDITYSLYLKKNNITIYKGYSKFPQNKEYDSFQWRKCIILKNQKDNLYKIKFKCLQNTKENKRKTKNLNIEKKSNIFSNENEKDEDIINKFDNTFILKEENIKDNLLILKKLD